MYTKVPSRSLCIGFGDNHHLISNFVDASSEGSGVLALQAVSPDWFSLLIFATSREISLVASFVLITFLNALLRESVVIFLRWLLGFTSR